jgi:hypothetical protein
MWQKIFSWVKKIILAVAVFSIYVFLFQFLEAKDGLEFYLGICATIITLYLYGKHDKI